MFGDSAVSQKYNTFVSSLGFFKPFFYLTNKFSNKWGLQLLAWFQEMISTTNEGYFGTELADFTTIKINQKKYKLKLLQVGKRW